MMVKKLFPRNVQPDFSNDLKENKNREAIE
jgi:hypothetical protein